MIQARTKGNPGSQAQSDRADARAASLAPILTKLRAGGVTSSGALAAALTARNIPTLSGRGPWSATAVRRVLKRLERLAENAAAEFGLHADGPNRCS
jgi:hypothetical protein